MKIIVLEGSPHKNGSSNLLAGEFIRGAKENGHDIQVLDVAHMDMHPCSGCGHCGMNGSCIHNDDNGIVKQALLEADMAVFVTPIYLFWHERPVKNGRLTVSTAILRSYPENI